MKNTIESYHYRDASGQWASRDIDTFEWLEKITNQACRIFGNEMRELFERFAHRCNEFSSGRNRAVFIFDNYVVKLPITEAGIGDNDWEGSVSGGHIPTARTRLVYYKSLPIVFMEYLSPASTDDINKKLGHYPDWVNCVDCGQVGWNRQGQLLAYDYGIN